MRELTNTAAGLPTAALADEILLEGEGRVRALFCLGGNPMMAWPDQRRAHRALESLDLLVTFDPELSASLGGPDLVLWIDESISSLPARIGYATQIDPPAAGHPAILADGAVIYRPGPQLRLRGLGTFAAGSGHGSGRAFFQAVFVDPGTGALVASNPIVLHLGL